jgi:hypothetical protein
MLRHKALFRGQKSKLYLLTIGLFLFAVAYTPFMFTGHAGAYGQILNRSLTISSGVPGAINVTYSFTFELATAAPAQSLKFIACTNAVSTYPGNTASCTPPTGMDFTSTAFSSQTGWQGATNFTVDNTGANDCIPVANILCATRTDNTNQSTAPGNDHTIVFNTIINPTTANTAFYVGIDTYSDIAYTAVNLVDFGATASAVVQTLTTNAAVAEVLNFCVGSTVVDDTLGALPNDCTGVSGTSINLGTLDTSQINISPFTINGGDSKNALAMVRSNAGNGTVIAYDAIQQSGTNHQGTLRISGNTCNPVTDTFVDPCINAAGAQNAFTAGTEEFGMTIAGINSSSSTSYVGGCQYGDTVNSIAPGNTCDMEPLSGYLGDGGSGTETYGTSNGFAWDETGAAVNIASSASSTIKQVDDEGLIIKFAATPSITTPFGAYAAQTDFIAVPTY